MKPVWKDLSRHILPSPLYALLKGMRLVYTRSSYLVETGFIRSYKTGVPCRLDGSPVPWMNYDVIRFLEKRLSKDQSLFEYGSGYSTLFYARLVAAVTSVEHDQGWLERVRAMIPRNVELIHQQDDVDGEYCRSILRTNRSFDVVVVDGRDRVNCVRQACRALSDRGVLVLDDSHRDRYLAAFEFMAEAGLRHIEFEGLKPRELGTYRTAVFYRDGNCFGI